MGEKRILGEIDPLTTADLKELTGINGPCVSMFLPTHPHGPETLQGRIRLNNLVDQAADDLRSADFRSATVEEWMNPVRALADDAQFWQHQSRGLAVFVAPGSLATYRLPIPVDEEVVVANSWRVRPLVSLLSGDGAFYMLALSKNSVRLFEATRHTISELDTGTIPKSIDEALAHEDPERELQVRAVGRPDALFHGHGAGAEVDNEQLERYFRVIDRELTETIGSDTRPLLLACVDYYLPIFRRVSRHQMLLDVAVEGNPEHESPDDLHASGWPLVEEHFAGRATRRGEHYREAAGTGMTASGIEEVVKAAMVGRVDTLFIAEGPPHWGRVDHETGEVEMSSTRAPLEEDLVDRALIETILHAGEVYEDDDLLEPGVSVAALLRY